jgi:carboxy-terminal domain RNA polymerase II polypeptide A small phosphatase
MNSTTIDSTAPNEHHKSLTNSGTANHDSTTVNGNPEQPLSNTSANDKTALSDKSQPTSGINTSKENVKSNSIASSRRASKAEPPVSSTTGPSAATASLNKKNESKKRGGPPKFLSFLSCCGGSRDDEDIDLGEHALPSSSGRQLATQQGSVKKDISTAESSTGESKDLPVEKIGGPPYSDLKSAGEPKIQEQKPTQLGSEEKRTSSKLGDAVVAYDPSPDAALSPKTDSADTGYAPVVPTEGNTVINDRTPQQEATDIEIEQGDSHPVDQEPVESPKQNEDSKTDPSPPLPPPPPMAPRRHGSSSSRQGDQSSINQTNGEQQKWLLPAVRPEHKGRKCLILDLDETLVHSSFKVSLSLNIELIGS